MKTILLLFLVAPLFSFGQWVQVGLDINGEASEDMSGYSLSLSNDVGFLTVGAYLNDGNGDGVGHVRVYENIATDPVYSAKGLQFEVTLTNIFRGDFLNIPFDRDESIFVILFDAYIKAYANYCESSLPSNKIELTEQVCDGKREIVTRDGFGSVVSRRWECMRWKTEPTGLYASPEMYNAKLVIESLQAYDITRNLFDPEFLIGTASSMLVDSQAAEADMITLLKMNSCLSPGLMRFQENLRLFAINKQPIRLGGKSNESVLSKNPNSHLLKLVDDLVFESSKEWLMNKYQLGSVSNVTVLSRDGQGRPSEIKTKYLFRGFSGQGVGTVRVTFNGGLPECLYFFDFPHECRTADRRIVTEYANGSYQKY